MRTSTPGWASAGDSRGGGRRDRGLDFVGAYPDRYGDGEDAPVALNLVWKATLVCDEIGLVPADDVSELRWFARDELPSADELAFRWLARCL